MENINQYQIGQLLIPLLRYWRVLKVWKGWISTEDGNILQQRLWSRGELDRSWKPWRRCVLKPTFRAHKKTDLMIRIPHQLSDPAFLGKYNIQGLWCQTFTFLIYFLISNSLFVFQEFGFTCTLPSAWNLDFQIQRKLWPSPQGKKKKKVWFFMQFWKMIVKTMLILQGLKGRMC